VRDAFLARGQKAISCDLLPSERSGPHIIGDVRRVLAHGWDLLIAHPPCTYLAVSGARWFKDNRAKQEIALKFVRLLLAAPVYRIAVENPISVISSRVRKPDQIISGSKIFLHSVQRTSSVDESHAFIAARPARNDGKNAAGRCRELPRQWLNNGDDSEESAPSNHASM
jgi:hypothetical protein